MAATRDVRGALELFELDLADHDHHRAFVLLRLDSDQRPCVLVRHRCQRLGFSTQDYLLRSADALFVPPGRGADACAARRWLHALVTRALVDGSRSAQLRRAAGVAIVVGWCSSRSGSWRSSHHCRSRLTTCSRRRAPGWALGCSPTACTSPADSASRGATGAGAGAPWTRSLSVTLVWLLIVLSGFSTASEYADALGRGTRRLWPGWTVGLGSPCTRRDASTSQPTESPSSGCRTVAQRTAIATRIRRLVHSAGKYFLVGDGWSHARGVAVVLSDGPLYRFEFGGGR